jgi:DNA-binding NarL/FixJ family response regulator
MKLGDRVRREREPSWKFWLLAASSFAIGLAVLALGTDLSDRTLVLVAVAGAVALSAVAAIEDNLHLRYRSAPRPVDSAAQAKAAPAVREARAEEVKEEGEPERLTPTLTARQKDIARLVAEGHTLREIGERLNLSVVTVQGELRAIMRSARSIS